MNEPLEETFIIPIQNSNGSRSEGIINIYNGGCVSLEMTDALYGGNRYDNAFDALREIRLEMEKDGRIPLVNGANRNAVVSGFALSQGGGLSIILVSLDDLNYRLIAHTFSSDQSTDPVFVSEQDAFRDNWWKALEMCDK